MSATLERLLALVSDDAGSSAASASLSVARVVSDSRDVRAGDLFVSLARGEAARAHFADALSRGAAAVVTSDASLVESVVVPDAARFLALAAEHLAGHPTTALRTIGVTGTNGKTTTSRLVFQALTALGARPALIGTGVLEAPGIDERSAFTTPFADKISSFAQRARDAGATRLVMEVSSHALEQKRVEAVRFDVAAFTNLTQDHLDYHGDMEAYGAAKARLFDELAPRASVIHVGDVFGRALADRARGEVLTVAIDAPADVSVAAYRSTSAGLEATLRTPFGDAELTSPLVGRHNLENLLVALGCLTCSGFALGPSVAALAGAPGAPGRLERVPDPDLAVFVDYAHTDDALRRVLEALRPLTAGRLLVVFGCGGDRDSTKRPKMGAVASASADVAVVTSDNPRTEDPARIVAHVLEGMDARERLEPEALAEASRGHVVELDRRRAIGLAIASARRGDTVLLAGKGHEDYQILGTTKVPFDDRLVARDALLARGRAA